MTRSRILFMQKQNNLLETEGWKRFKKVGNMQKKLPRLSNHIKLRSFWLASKYKYEYQVPRNYQQTKKLDDITKSIEWQECTILKMS